MEHAAVILMLCVTTPRDPITARAMMDTMETEKHAKVTMGAYHLARKSGNLGLKSNGKVIFRKFCSEIVEYLQRYSSFSVQDGTVEISLPFVKLSTFQSLISRK